MASSASLRWAFAALFTVVYLASTAWACVRVSGPVGDGEGAALEGALRAGPGDLPARITAMLGITDGEAGLPVAGALGWPPVISTAAAPTPAAPAASPAGSSQRRPACWRPPPESAGSPVLWASLSQAGGGAGGQG